MFFFNKRSLAINIFMSVYPAVKCRYAVPILAKLFVHLLNMCNNFLRRACQTGDLPFIIIGGLLSSWKSSVPQLPCDRPMTYLLFVTFSSYLWVISLTNIQSASAVLRRQITPLFQTDFSVCFWFFSPHKSNNTAAKSESFWNWRQCYMVLGRNILML